MAGAAPRPVWTVPTPSTRAPSALPTSTPVLPSHGPSLKPGFLCETCRVVSEGPSASRALAESARWPSTSASSVSTHPLPVPVLFLSDEHPQRRGGGVAGRGHASHSCIPCVWVSGRMANGLGWLTQSRGWGRKASMGLEGTPLRATVTVQSGLYLSVLR